MYVMEKRINSVEYKQVFFLIFKAFDGKEISKFTDYSAISRISFIDQSGCLSCKNIFNLIFGGDLQ